METSEKERIRAIISYLNISDSEFAQRINIPQGTISNIFNRNTSPSITVLKNIITHIGVISPEWLLTGEGEMLRAEDIPCIESKASLVPEELKRIGGTAPLYDSVAAAGYGSFDEMLTAEKVVDNYVLPQEFKRVDFLIRVTGDSMEPHYLSGDIIACRIINEKQFVQWGKVYVAATKEQGLLVKRLDTNNDNSIVAVSDNPTYKPFIIGPDQICGIALVVGLIRLE
ncbi:MAG: S24 family peptidase [Bacteroidales bacterium]